MLKLKVILSSDKLLSNLYNEDKKLMICILDVHLAVENEMSHIQMNTAIMFNCLLIDTNLIKKRTENYVFANNSDLEHSRNILEEKQFFVHWLYTSTSLN